jgi:predicted DNA-binding protein
MGAGNIPLTLSAAAGLVSAVATVVTLYLRSRTKERLKAMENATGETKAKLAADAIAMFDISTSGLSTEQQYRLAVKQLEDRSKQRQRQFIAFLFVTSLLAATAVVFAVIEGKPGSTVIQQSGPGGINVNGSEGATVKTGSGTK